MDEVKHVVKASKLWQADWKSPVSLGIFFAGAGIGFAVVVFTLLNLWVTDEQLKSQSSSAMTQQEMQQLESQGSTAAPADSTTGAPAQ
jgi:hypothetical protein